MGSPGYKGLCEGPSGGADLCNTLGQDLASNMLRPVSCQPGLDCMCNWLPFAAADYCCSCEFPLTMPCPPPPPSHKHTHTPDGSTQPDLSEGQGLTGPPNGWRLLLICHGAGIYKKGSPDHFCSYRAALGSKLEASGLSAQQEGVWQGLIMTEGHGIRLHTLTGTWQSIISSSTTMPVRSSPCWQ